MRAKSAPAVGSVQPFASASLWFVWASRQADPVTPRDNAIELKQFLTLATHLLHEHSSFAMTLPNPKLWKKISLQEVERGERTTTKTHEGRAPGQYSGRNRRAGTSPATRSAPNPKRSGGPAQWRRNWAVARTGP